MKNLSTHITESFVNEDVKDDIRINDIILKAGGVHSKEYNLAKNMAKAITDKSKCERRYASCLTILGKDHLVSHIFADRCEELGISPKNIKPAAVIIHQSKVATVATENHLGSKMSSSNQQKAKDGHTDRGYQNRGISILPCGSVNFKSGENKYFNSRTNGDGCFEIWKTSDGKLRCVSTSGTTPMYGIGASAYFSHDQTGRELFVGVMIDYCDVQYMEQLIPLYGKSMMMYVYK